MKRSLKSKYHFFIGIMFILMVLQSASLLIAVSQAKNLMGLASDIQSIVIIFLFGGFVYFVFLYNYIPFKLHKAINEVEKLVEQISNGNYQIDIDSSIYDQDKDIQQLIFALEKMLGIVSRFDQVKADKIFEHHQRIQLLINLVAHTVLITGANGDVVYCNEPFRKRFPLIAETMNLGEVIWKDDYHVRIFSVITNALRYGNNISNVVVENLVYLGRVSISGSIVRSCKGISTGAVFVMHFTEHEKQN